MVKAAYEMKPIQTSRRESAYKTLGIAEDSTEHEIISAYKRMLHLTDPINGGDEIANRAVQRAYEVLSNEQPVSRDSHPKSDYAMIALVGWIIVFLLAFIAAATGSYIVLLISIVLCILPIAAHIKIGQTISKH